MSDDSGDFEQTLRAYRKSRFTIICHAVFIGLCALVTVLSRRFLGLPTQVLVTVLVVALVVFGRDIMVFFALRSKVARLRGGS